MTIETLSLMGNSLGHSSLDVRVDLHFDHMTSCFSLPLSFVILTSRSGLQLFADECAARRIFDEVLLCQRNVETGQTQRWAGSNATFDGQN